MKKFIGILAFAAIALLGCDKKNDAESFSLPQPPAIQDHATIIFEIEEEDEAPEVPSPANDDTDLLKDIVISSSGDGVAFFFASGPVRFQLDNQTRAPRIGGKFKINRVGEFSIIEVEEFAYPPKGGLSAYASVKIGFKSARGGEELVFNGYLLEEPYADNQLCRSWTVDEILLSLDGASAAKTFKGCNLGEISSYLRDKGIKVKQMSETLAVDKMILAESGKFAILLTEGEPYYGDFDLSDNGAFSYNLMYTSDPVIAEEASGSIAVVKGGKVRLALNAELKDSDKKPYKIEIIFFLLPA